MLTVKKDMPHTLSSYLGGTEPSKPAGNPLLCPAARAETQSSQWNSTYSYTILAHNDFGQKQQAYLEYNGAKTRNRVARLGSMFGGNTALLYCSKPYTASGDVRNTIDGFASKSENPLADGYGGLYHNQKLLTLFSDGSALAGGIPAKRVNSKGEYSSDSWIIAR
ncbi:hypothetical protein SDC9_197465 [bioreactor metagenome]|uniref:Uncharacterized protein n=1 Tax=bioreactor metagenome TaxID=1076179 RepID=A0A645IG75_9ZZZZ